MSDEYKKLSIDLHNKYRNEVATGKVPGYKKAARMATLVSKHDEKTLHAIIADGSEKLIIFFLNLVQVWDEILAKLAELNAKTCVFAHDTCRNTGKNQ